MAAARAGRALEFRQPARVVTHGARQIPASRRLVAGEPGGDGGRGGRAHVRDARRAQRGKQARRRRHPPRHHWRAGRRNEGHVGAGAAAAEAAAAGDGDAGKGEVGRQLQHRGRALLAARLGGAHPDLWDGRSPRRGRPGAHDGEWDGRPHSAAPH